MILKKSMGTAPRIYENHITCSIHTGLIDTPPLPTSLSTHTYKPSHTILSSYTRVSYGFNSVSSGNLFSASG